MAEKNDSKVAGSFERSSNEIRSDIAARRESITQTVGELGNKIHDTLDWKGYVARYPYAAVGLAVGTGLLIGLYVNRRTSPSERIINALTDKAEELGDELRDSVRKLIMRTAAPSLIRGTIYGLASKALMQYLQSRAAHAEGNGASLHDQWSEMRPAASTPPNVS